MRFEKRVTMKGIKSPTGKQSSKDNRKETTWIIIFDESVLSKDKILESLELWQQGKEDDAWEKAVYGEVLIK